MRTEQRDWFAGIEPVVPPSASGQSERSTSKSGVTGVTGVTRAGNPQEPAPFGDAALLHPERVEGVTGFTPPAQGPVTPVTPCRPGRCYNGGGRKSAENLESFGSVTPVTPVTPTNAQEAQTSAGGDGPPAVYTPEADFEERAAIIEYEAGVPRRWAEGFARLLTARRPASIPPGAWAEMIDAAALLLEKWGRQLAALGWDTVNLFGVHPEKPLERLDQAGLVRLLLDGRRVVAVTSRTATLQYSDGTLVTYYRRSRPGSVALWELT